MSRREPRPEYPLGHWWGASLVPPCTWPSPPQEAPSSSGLGHGKGREQGCREEGLRGEVRMGQGQRGCNMGLGTGCVRGRGEGAVVTELQV